MFYWTESPYIAALKDSFVSSRCSSCFKSCFNKCNQCERVVYCNDQCQMNDKMFHEIECQFYKKCLKRDDLWDSVIARMMVRIIIRLSIDGGKPEIDLCSNVSQSILRRSWSDLLGHRDEIPFSSRHYEEWLKTKEIFQFYFGDQFNHFDLFEIFGKILINRFRVGIHSNILDGRIAVGWAIYLTTSRFNHSCEPDLLQCSYDINIRLKLVNGKQNLPETTDEFDRLTVNYRHQNDFRLTNPFSYVPTRQQRRKFVNFFFFNCHCSFCADDLRNRYLEASTNRLCEQCGDYLILQDNFQQNNTSILSCLGRKKCFYTDQIVQCLPISIKDHHDQSIDTSEMKLKSSEELFHPQSLLLLQQREKLFFTYQKLLTRCHSNENERQKFLLRCIELGELLIEGYDFHLKDSSFYPKVFLTDFAALCESAQMKNKAKLFYQKAMKLWHNDYKDFIDFSDLRVKL